jgi:Outer membrane protein beta-barrel domain
MRSAVALLLLLAAPASAQVVGVALLGAGGTLLPKAPFRAAPVYMGGFDARLSPRVSVRPSFLWAETPLAEEADGTLRRAVLQWDVIVNWDRGGWRPFLATGVGMHLFQRKVDGRGVGEHDELTFGLTVGAGLEVFVARATALVGEVTYSAVEQGRLASSPSAITIRSGVKRYF